MRNVAIPLPQLGIDLLTDETSLKRGTVREALNVDLKKSGAFSRRPGHTIEVAGDGFTGIFADERGVLVGRGTKVYAIDPDTYAPTLLCDMGREAPVDFTKYNGHVYFTNPGSSWWVPSDSDLPRQLGAALPAALPTIQAHDAGSLTPGLYSVAISYVDDRGEESPTKNLGTVETTAGIRLEGLQLLAAGKYRVYLTPASGDVLYLAAEFAAVFSQYIVSTQPDGKVRTSQYLRPLPGGDFIRGHAGRLYVVADDTVLFSEPLRPHLYDPRHNFIKFTGKVRMFEPTTGGIFVGDDNGVWWMPGNEPTKTQLVKKIDAKVIRRSALRVPDAYLPGDDTGSDAIVWLGTAGYVIGRPDGSVSSMHPERIAVAADLEGRSVLVLRDGMKQVITLVAASTLAAQTFGVAIDSSVQ